MTYRCAGSHGFHAAARAASSSLLVVERQGDPRHVQQHRSPTGRIIKWDSESSAAGRELEQALRAQHTLFVEKFGREPGPGDPLFFDPGADEPTPLEPAGDAAMWEEMLAAAEDADIDPALIHAARELGFLLTDENRHMFSAMEVEEWRQAVLSYRGEPDDAAEDGETGADQLDHLAQRLELVVEETLLSGGDTSGAKAETRNTAE